MAFYNGFKDDVRKWDDDKLFQALKDMQIAMRLLGTRGSITE